MPHQFPNNNNNNNNRQARAAPITSAPSDQRDEAAAAAAAAVHASSQAWMKNTLATLELRLEADRDLTRFQPPQVAVVDPEDGDVRVVLLTTAELFRQQQAVASVCYGGVGGGARSSSSPVPSTMLRGSDFRVTERYRCLADHRGQVKGGVGFIFEGVDLIDTSKVAVKFFHQMGDGAASSMEISTSVQLHHRLHSGCIDRDDQQDLLHVARLRDVLIDAPILDDRCERGGGGGGLGPGLGPPTFRATVMVFDWADAGDAQSFVEARDGIAPAEGAVIFRQLMRGLRALHRRGIVHRDVKPENILLSQEGRTASLCDFGFAKHAASAHAAELICDPTTCYQSPERWQACHSRTAAIARGGGGSGGNGSVVPRRDEIPSQLFVGDVFSAGVSLFVLVAHEAIWTRIVAEATCQDMSGGGGGGGGGGDQSSVLPAMNVFQRAAGGGMFELLEARVPTGGAQRRFWAYWEAYGLRLPSALRGLLDGVLHPVPELRFSMQHVFAWMDCHPDMFVSQA